MTIHKSGNLCGQKALYEYGVECCVWYPYGNDDDAGVCFDFDFDDIDDFIALLKQLKNAEPIIHEELK